MFEYDEGFDGEGFPQEYVELDKLQLTPIHKYHIAGSDLVRFRNCMDEIYHDQIGVFYSIVKYCIQQNDIGKLKCIERLIPSIDRDYIIYWIILYWAWELQQYEIFAWALDEHLRAPDDYVYMRLVIKKDNWPEELAEIFEALPHTNNTVTCEMRKKYSFSKYTVEEEIMFTKMTANTREAIYKKYPNICKNI